MFWKIFLESEAPSFCCLTTCKLPALYEWKKNKYLWFEPHLEAGYTEAHKIMEMALMMNLSLVH